MTTIAHDLRQMLRALARRPGYAATVAITLGLGIGATTTIVAVPLAAIGLYGTLAFTGRSCLREIGIRMAMGATERQIFALVLRQGLAVLAVGLTSGILGALALTRLIQAFLYRVRPIDPVSFLSALAILTVAVLSPRSGPRDPPHESIR